MSDFQVHVIRTSEDLDAVWIAIALVYGSPPSMLDANAFEIQKERQKFRDALVLQWPNAIHLSINGAMSVHRQYTE